MPSTSQALSAAFAIALPASFAGALAVAADGIHVTGCWANAALGDTVPISKLAGAATVVCRDGLHVGGQQWGQGSGTCCLRRELTRHCMGVAGMELLGML